MRARFLLGLIGGSVATLSTSLAQPLAAPTTAAGEKIWSMFYDADMKTYATNLRRAGAPDPVVALLISDAVNERFAAQEVQLQPSLLSAKALKEEFSSERREALIQLRIQKHALLREALGFVPEKSARIEWPSELLARLDARDRDTIRHIADDYTDMIVRIIAESHGHLLAEDREKIRYLEAERSKDLGNYLTTEEILDYELLETDYGRGIRSRLRFFEPTREQLRTYLSVAKKYDYHLASEDANLARRSAAKISVNAELARIWDEQTYARYRRSISLQYQELFKLVARLKLPAAIANEIYESEKNTTERSQQLFGTDYRSAVTGDEDIFGTIRTYIPREDFQSQTMQQRARQIADLIEGHLAFVGERLGVDGLKQYEAMGRSWIQAMRGGAAVQMDYSKK